ncbi:MAG: methyl-coenzyme M reductase family protein [Methanomassiliicoccales archaeon]|jgi:putative methanogenesis marker protein 7|nr:methyl-coenzyme M reductase family protein [Methanomassiliicoccales archaeon]
MYKVLLFDGGVYRVNELYELVEDVGGFIIQKTQTHVQILVTLAIPEEEKDVIERKSQELGAKLTEIPLGGTEIAVVAPTLGRHHMPHPVCDIAEHLRRYGAITVVMGLARGKGRKSAQISAEEKALINEYDAAVFVLGNFEDCIKTEKVRLFEDIKVPVVVACGPSIDALPNCKAIVSGVCRRVERMRRAEDIAKLEEVAEKVSKVIEERRRIIDEDPLFVHPAEVRQRIETLPVVQKSLRPAPIVLHLDGLRVKIPYYEWKDQLESIEVYGRKLREIAELSDSRLDGSTLIRIYSASKVESMNQLGSVNSLGDRSAASAKE